MIKKKRVKNQILKMMQKQWMIQIKKKKKIMKRKMIKLKEKKKLKKRMEMKMKMMKNKKKINVVLKKLNLKRMMFKVFHLMN